MPAVAKEWTREEEDAMKWGKWPVSTLLREDGEYTFWSTSPYLAADEDCHWRVIFTPQGTENKVSMSLDSDNALMNAPEELKLENPKKALKFINDPKHNAYDRAAFRFLTIVGWKGSPDRKKVDTAFLKTYMKLCAHRYIETLLSSSSYIDGGQPLEEWDDYKKTMKKWLG